MLKGQDILVLLRLLGQSDDWTFRSLGESVDLDPAGVHRALQRLRQARLVDAERPLAMRSNAEEFLVHALKYLFPARQGGLTRGVPTAWAAPPLNDELASADEPPPVWPHPRGSARGISIEPVDPRVPELAQRDDALAEQLALLDAIRLGDGRVRSLATKRLSERLRAAAPV